jgi:hypothetical protein
MTRIAYGRAAAWTVLALVVALAGCEHDEGQGASDRTPPGIKIVNSTCPIMNVKIDPARVPPELMRTHRGQVVGFCCPTCVATWDHLSEPERQAKLDKVMTPASAPATAPSENSL